MAVWRRWPDLELVGHHVAQPLVVDATHKDVRLQLLTIDTTVHSLVAIVIVPTYTDTQHSAYYVHMCILCISTQFPNMCTAY